jgi:hypothetical protein
MQVEELRAYCIYQGGGRRHNDESDEDDEGEIAPWGESSLPVTNRRQSLPTLIGDMYECRWFGYGKCCANFLKNSGADCFFFSQVQPAFRSMVSTRQVSSYVCFVKLLHQRQTLWIILTYHSCS